MPPATCLSPLGGSFPPPPPFPNDSPPGPLTPVFRPGPFPRHHLSQVFWSTEQEDASLFTGQLQWSRGGGQPKRFCVGSMQQDQWQAAGESKICSGAWLLVLGGRQANGSDAQLLLVQWDGRQTARSHSHHTPGAEAVAKGIKMEGPHLVLPLFCPSACSLPIWCSLRRRGNGSRGVKILRH